MQKNERAKKNRGFSLVELLVTISILTILTASAGISIALAFSRDAEKCAKEIDAALERSRMFAMSKTGENTFELTVSDSGGQIYLHDLDETIKLQSRVQITLQSGGSDVEIEAVKVTFDKSTGRVKSIQTAASGAEASDYGDALLKLKCTNHSGTKTAFVTLIKNTGKHYVEYE